MSDVRPLPFPLNYAQSLTALVDEGGETFDLPTFPSDSNERIDVIMNLSLTEFVKLATSIDVGSDIAYGNEAVAIWYIWVRSIMSESLCAKIEECVLTSTGVRDAIGGIFTSDIDTPQYQQLLEKIQDDLEETITPITSADCNDKLWGSCIQFVEILNRNALDYLEQLEVAPVEQALEIANNLASAPLVDEVGLDAITSTIEWAVDQLFDYYTASFTDEYRDALACEVFCRVKDTCSISVNDFYEVLKERALVNVLDPNDIVAVALSIVQVTFTGADNRVCDVWLYWNLELARLGNLLTNSLGVASAFGFGNAMTRLKTQVKLGLNNPDRDWILLCGDCVVPNQLEIYSQNGTNTLTYDGTEYTLSVARNTFASIRRIGGNQANCTLSFTPTGITVVSGNATGREFRNCPSGTINSANAPVTQANNITMSYLAVSSTGAIGGTNAVIRFKIL